MPSIFIRSQSKTSTTETPVDQVEKPIEHEEVESQRTELYDRLKREELENHEELKRCSLLDPLKIQLKELISAFSDSLIRVTTLSGINVPYSILYEGSLEGTRCCSKAAEHYLFIFDLIRSGNALFTPSISPLIIEMCTQIAESSRRIEELKKKCDDSPSLIDEARTNPLSQLFKPAAEFFCEQIQKLRNGQTFTMPILTKQVDQDHFLTMVFERTNTNHFNIWLGEAQPASINKHGGERINSRSHCVPYYFFKDVPWADLFYSERSDKGSSIVFERLLKLQIIPFAVKKIPIDEVLDALGELQPYRSPSSSLLEIMLPQRGLNCMHKGMNIQIFRILAQNHTGSPSSRSEAGAVPDVSAGRSREMMRFVGSRRSMEKSSEVVAVERRELFKAVSPMLRQISLAVRFYTLVAYYHSVKDTLIAELQASTYYRRDHQIPIFIEACRNFLRTMESTAKNPRGLLSFEDWKRAYATVSEMISQFEDIERRLLGERAPEVLIPPTYQEAKYARDCVERFQTAHQLQLLPQDHGYFASHSFCTTQLGVGITWQELQSTLTTLRDKLRNLSIIVTEEKPNSVSHVSFAQEAVWLVEFTMRNLSHLKTSLPEAAAADRSLTTSQTSPSTALKKSGIHIDGLQITLYQIQTLYNRFLFKVNDLASPLTHNTAAEFLAFNYLFAVAEDKQGILQRFSVDTTPFFALIREDRLAHIQDPIVLEQRKNLESFFRGLRQDHIFNFVNLNSSRTNFLKEKVPDALLFKAYMESDVTIRQAFERMGKEHYTKKKDQTWKSDFIDEELERTPYEYLGAFHCFCSLDFPPMLFHLSYLKRAAILTAEACNIGNIDRDREITCRKFLEFIVHGTNASWNASTGLTDRFKRTSESDFSMTDSDPRISQKVQQYRNNSQSSHYRQQISSENSLQVKQRKEITLESDLDLSAVEPDLETSVLLEKLKKYFLHFKKEYECVFDASFFKLIIDDDKIHSPFFEATSIPEYLVKFEQLIKEAKRCFVDIKPEATPSIREMIYVNRLCAKALQGFHQTHPDFDFPMNLLLMIKEQGIFLHKASSLPDTSEELRAEINLTNLGLLLCCPLKQLGSDACAELFLHQVKVRSEFKSISICSDIPFARDCKRKFVELEKDWQKVLKDKDFRNTFGNYILNRLLNYEQHLEWKLTNNILQAKDDKEEWNIHLLEAIVRNSNGILEIHTGELTSSPDILRLFGKKKYAIKTFGNEVRFYDVKWHSIRILGGKIQRHTEDKDWQTYVDVQSSLNVLKQGSLCWGHVHWASYDAHGGVSIQICDLHTGQEVALLSSSPTTRKSEVTLKQSNLKLQLLDERFETFETFDDLSEVTCWHSLQKDDSSSDSDSDSDNDVPTPNVVQFNRFRDSENNLLTFPFHKGTFLYSSNEQFIINQKFRRPLNFEISRYTPLISKDKKKQKIIIPIGKISSSAYVQKADIALPHPSDDNQKMSLRFFEYDLIDNRLVSTSIGSRIYYAHLTLAQKHYRHAINILQTISITEKISVNDIQLLANFIFSSEDCDDKSPNACGVRLYAYYVFKKTNPFLRLSGDSEFSDLCELYEIYLHGLNNVELSQLLDREAELQLIGFLNRISIRQGIIAQFVTDREKLLLDKPVDSRQTFCQSPPKTVVQFPQVRFYISDKEKEQQDSSRFNTYFYPYKRLFFPQDYYYKAYQAIQEQSADSFIVREIIYTLRTSECKDDWIELILFIFLAKTQGHSIPVLQRRDDSNQTKIAWYCALESIAKAIRNPSPGEKFNYSFGHHQASESPLQLPGPKVTNLANILHPPTTKPLWRGVALVEPLLFAFEGQDQVYKSWVDEYLHPLSERPALPPNLLRDKVDIVVPDWEKPFELNIQQRQEFYHRDCQQAYEQECQKKKLSKDANYIEMLIKIQRERLRASQRESILSDQIWNIGNRKPAVFKQFVDHETTKKGRNIEDAFFDKILSTAAREDGIHALKRLNHFLSDEECSHLRSLSIEYLIERTHREQVDRVLLHLQKYINSDETDETAFLTLEEVLQETRTYDPTQQPLLAFCELKSEARFRRKQAVIMDDLLKLVLESRSEAVIGAAFQLIMGGGKTSMIISTLMELLAEAGYLCIVFGHHSQIPSLKGTLPILQEKRHNKKVYFLDYTLDNLFEEDFLDITIHTVNQAIKERCPIIQHSTLIQVTECALPIAISRLGKHSDKTKYLAIIHKLQTLLLLLKDESVGFFDECDINLETFVHVNIPLDQAHNIDPEQCDFMMEIYSLLISPEMIDVNGQKMIDLVGLTTDSQAKLPKESFHKIVIPFLADKLFNYSKFRLNDPKYKPGFERYVRGKIPVADQQLADDLSVKIDSETLSQESKENILFLRRKSFLKKSTNRYENDADKLLTHARETLTELLILSIYSSNERQYGRDKQYDDGRPVPFLGVGCPSSTKFASVKRILSVLFQISLSSGVTKKQIIFLADRMTEVANHYARKQGIDFSLTKEAEQFKQMTNIPLREFNPENSAMVDQAYQFVNSLTKFHLRLEKELKLDTSVSFSSINSGITKDQVLFVAEKMSHAAHQEKTARRVTFEETQEAKDFEEMTSVPLIEFSTSDNIDKAVKYINNQINFHRRLKVESELAPHHTQYRRKWISHNAINKTSTVKKKIACSGTLWNAPTLTKDFGDPMYDGGTEGSILNLMSQRAKDNVNWIHNLPSAAFVNILNVIRSHPQKNRVRGLIDAAGILKEAKLAQLVLILNPFLHAEIPELECIAYLHTFSEDEVKKGSPKESYVAQKMGQTKLLLLNNLTKDEFQRYGINKDKVFIIFDELRCFGTDTELFDLAILLMTVDDKMTLRTFLQALIRARKLSKQQLVELMVLMQSREEMVNHGNEFEDCTATWIKNEAMLLKRQKDHADNLQIKDIIRREMIDDIEHEKDPIKLEKLNESYSDFIFSTSQPNQNNSSGVILGKVNKLAYLRKESDKLVADYSTLNPRKASLVRQNMDRLMATFKKEILADEEIDLDSCGSSAEATNEVFEEQQTTLFLQETELKLELHLQHELEGYSYAVSPIEFRESKWPIKPFIPIWNQLAPHCRRISDVLSQTYKNKGKSVTTDAYAKVWPPFLHGTNFFNRSTEEEVPIFHPANKTSHFIVAALDKSTGIYNFVFLSLKEADSFKAYLNTPPSRDDAFLLNLSGEQEANLQQKVPFEDLKDGLWWANLFAGNIEYLYKDINYSKEMLKRIKERGSLQKLTQFLLLRCARDPINFSRLLNCEFFVFPNSALPQSGLIFSSRREEMEIRYFQTSVLDEAEVKEIKPEFVEYLSGVQVKWLTRADQVERLTLGQLNDLEPHQADLMSPLHVPHVTNPKVIQGITDPGLFSFLKPETQYQYMGPHQISLVHSANLRHIPPKILMQCSPQDVSCLGNFVRYLEEADQINGIDVSQLTDLSDEQYKLLINPKLIDAVQPEKIHLIHSSCHKYITNSHALLLLETDEFLIPLQKEWIKDHFAKCGFDENHLKVWQVVLVPTASLGSIKKPELIEAIFKAKLYPYISYAQAGLIEQDDRDIINQIPWPAFMGLPKRVHHLLTPNHYDNLNQGFQQSGHSDSLTIKFIKGMTAPHASHLSQEALQFISPVVVSELSREAKCKLSKLELVFELKEEEESVRKAIQNNIYEVTPNLSAEDIADWPDTPLQFVPIQFTHLIDTQRIAGLKREHYPHFTKNQVEAIPQELRKPEFIRELGSDGLEGVLPSEIDHLSDLQLCSLTPEKHLHLIQAIKNPNTLSKLSPGGINSIRPEQVPLLQTLSILCLRNPVLFLAITPEQKNDLFQAKLDDFYKEFFTKRINEIKKELALMALQNIPRHFYDLFDKEHHLVHIQALNDADSFGLLSDDALNAINPDQVSLLSSKDLLRLNDPELLIRMTEAQRSTLTQSGLHQDSIDRVFGIIENHVRYSEFHTVPKHFYDFLHYLQVENIDNREDLLRLAPKQLGFLTNDQAALFEDIDFTIERIQEFNISDLCVLNDRPTLHQKANDLSPDQIAELNADDHINLIRSLLPNNLSYLRKDALQNIDEPQVATLLPQDLNRLTASHLLLLIPGNRFIDLTPAMIEFIRASLKQYPLDTIPKHFYHLLSDESVKNINNRDDLLILGATQLGELTQEQVALFQDEDFTGDRLRSFNVDALQAIDRRPLLHNKVNELTDLQLSKLNGQQHKNLIQQLLGERLCHLQNDALQYIQDSQVSQASANELNRLSAPHLLLKIPKKRGLELNLDTLKRVRAAVIAANLEDVPHHFYEFLTRAQVLNINNRKDLCALNETQIPILTAEQVNLFEDDDFNSNRVQALNHEALIVLNNRPSLHQKGQYLLNNQLSRLDGTQHQNIIQALKSDHLSHLTQDALQFIQDSQVSDLTKTDLNRLTNPRLLLRIPVERHSDLLGKTEQLLMEAVRDCEDESLINGSHLPYITESSKILIIMRNPHLLYALTPALFRFLSIEQIKLAQTVKLLDKQCINEIFPENLEALDESQVSMLNDSQIEEALLFPKHLLKVLPKEKLRRLNCNGRNINQVPLQDHQHLTEAQLNALYSYQGFRPKQLAIGFVCLAIFVPRMIMQTAFNILKLSGLAILSTILPSLRKQVPLQLRETVFNAPVRIFASLYIPFNYGLYRRLCMDHGDGY